MENERVERLRLRQVGEDWIRAITEGALERLEGLLPAGGRQPSVNPLAVYEFR